MTDTAVFKKNKIELTDYDSSKDILNRVLMAAFTPLDLEVLEEILYSSIRIPLSVLEQNLSLSPTKLQKVLNKLKPSGLFEVKDDFVLVDKEMRKYYELHIQKFEEDFDPGMEYLQGLLKNIPIHILPNWYAISRTSDNIFESIVEKYLYTPQIFQRYLVDLPFSDPVQQAILNEVYNSPTYEVQASQLIKKFNLTQEKFEEHLLFLELNLAACIKYKKIDGWFVETVTLFQEWHHYLSYLKKTDLNSIIDEEEIVRKKKDDFGFINELEKMLELIQKNGLSSAALKKKCPEFEESDFDYYVEKLCQINLAAYHKGAVVCTSDAIEWLKMKPSERALFLYRHPLNSLENAAVPEALCTHKTIREAEKSLSRVVNNGWVFLEEFLKGVLIPLKDEHQITLMRHGRHWGYQLPNYSAGEKAFFRALIEQWLFEVGMVALGTKEGHPCFCLTPFGRDLFSNE